MLGAAAIGFAVQWALSYVDPIGGAPALFSRFNALHFEINYLDHGFVKRGLVGTLFQFIPVGMRTTAVIVFAFATIGALAAVVSVVLACAQRRNPDSDMRGLMASWVVAPVAFVNFGYDFARLDQFNFLLLAGSLYALRGGHVGSAAALTVIALLVHEAYLFYGVPLLVGYALSRGRPRRAAFRLAAASMAALAVLLVFGGFEAGRQVLVERLGDRLRPGSANALDVWLRASGDNIAYVADRLAAPLFGPGELAGFAAAIVLVLIGLFALYRRNGCALDALALAPLGVLPLFVFGVDYARWVALIGLSAMTVVLLQCLDGRFRCVSWAVSRSTRRATMAVAVVLGPFGTVHAFPIYSRFVSDLF